FQPGEEYVEVQLVVAVVRIVKPGIVQLVSVIGNKGAVKSDETLFMKKAKEFKTASVYFFEHGKVPVPGRRERKRLVARYIFKQEVYFAIVPQYLLCRQ